MQEKLDWVAARFVTGTEPPPFSFTYYGKPSGGFLGNWAAERETARLDDGRMRHTVQYTGPESGLTVLCEAVEYMDFPTVEWTLRFRNAGGSDTPLLEGIKALDLPLRRGKAGAFTLRRIRGDTGAVTSFEPMEEALQPGETRIIAPWGGRPTNYAAPYFNLEWEGHGLIAAIGWPGQWSVEFRRADLTGLRVAAGQERTRFRLRPGEEARSPRIVLQFWHGGDWVHAQNVWRRWMMAYNMPKPNGALPGPILLGTSSRMYAEMVEATEGNQKACIDRYVEERLPIDAWWMDAGWYPNFGKWSDVGTWEVDRGRFPRGIRAVSDHAHSRGMGSLLWFEPERVKPDTALDREHPEWLLESGGKQKLFNLGDPEALAWLIRRVDGLIASEGIDVYRQDFNMNPLDHWRVHDAPDRQGITEIRYVEGFLTFWDELLRRHPGLLIDTCASGGRRLDVETLKRSVPLWRSDYRFETIGHQGMTQGLSFWIPFHGTGTTGNDVIAAYAEGFDPLKPHVFLSNMAPSLVLSFDVRVRELDYEGWRRLIGQWRAVSGCYSGDYYPLAPYSTRTDSWAAWQFHRRETGEGMVQAFRRSESIHDAEAYRLRGLDPDLPYRFSGLDGGRTGLFQGRKLMEEGLTVRIPERPGAALIRYEAEEDPSRPRTG